MKNLKECVDILIKEGTENPKKWMVVPQYSEPNWYSNDGRGWAIEWRKLKDHHMKETEFLFKVIEELRRRLLPEKKNDE